jgi:hypothetical protein
MPIVRCSVCLSPRRAEVDKALLRGEPTTRISKDMGFSQAAVSRHNLKHVRPQAKAVAQALAPMIMPPPSPVDILPSMHSMLAKLGETITRAENLVADAEAAGGIAGRAVSITALRQSLVDTAKLLSVLGPQQPKDITDDAILLDVRQAARDIAEATRGVLMAKGAAK